MDVPRSMSIIPPTGSQPLRTKSLRQQRASNGANMIKAYVQQSEQRREQSKFHSGPRRIGTAASMTTPRGSGDGGLLDERDESAVSPRASTAGAFSPRSEMMHGNQEKLDDAHALDALFADRRVHRSRRPSVYVAARRPSVTGTGLHASNAGEHTSHLQHEQSIRPIERRRLQMETASASVHFAGDNGTPASSTPHNHHAHSIRSATTAFVPHHPRTRHNLAAKLDALAKSSAWGRRKVVLNNDDKGVKGLPKTAMSRHASPLSSSSHNNGADNHHTNSSGGHSSKEMSESEIEMRVMAAFRQIVRLWRERKRKAEAAAMSKMNRTSNGIATGTGRNGSKLRKDLTAQSSNVVGIISRRLIREIPALKFFDDEPDPVAASVSGVKPRKASTVGAAIPSAMAASTPAVVVERATPRGVCYTLDAFGCRKIKMQSSTTIATATPQRNSKSNQKPKTEEIVTLEKAMSRSLHRKMARRIKSKRSSILKLSDEFSKSRRDLAMKLRSQLALQHAEIEKTFSTRLTLLMSDDASLPPYKAQKELHLARLRCKKANLLQKCETLRVLGLILKHVEAVGNTTGLEASTGELHFLDLFRCVVEENQVLTPIISDALRQHMRPQDLIQPVIMELFRILDVEMHRS